MTHRCREKQCAKRFSLKTGTVMEGSKFGFQVWVIATYLMSTNLKSVPSMKLHRDLDITQRSAWFLAHRLRVARLSLGSGFRHGGRDRRWDAVHTPAAGDAPCTCKLVVRCRDRRASIYGAAGDGTRRGDSLGRSMPAAR